VFNMSWIHRYACALSTGRPLAASSSAIVASLLSSPTHSQVDIIAAYGERLLEWLQKYTFPAESKFAAACHATACADFFVKELLRNGTTCALAFCTVHAGSVDALLEKAADAGMMMICGKVNIFMLYDQHTSTLFAGHDGPSGDDTRKLEGYGTGFCLLPLFIGRRFFGRKGGRGGGGAM
jgi:cytosine/adenosine deaminase-related metal-dependent hydrolase